MILKAKLLENEKLNLKLINKLNEADERCKNYQQEIASLKECLNNVTLERNEANLRMQNLINSLDMINKDSQEKITVKISFFIF